MNQYDFEYVGGAEESYIFETDQRLIYEVKYKLFDYLFENTKEYTYKTYELIIGVLYSPVQIMPPSDNRIPPTIAAIVYDFFQRRPDPVVLYVCDSSDGRQMVRNRKFSVWFAEYQHSNITKIDIILKDRNGENVPISMILELSNPYFEEIIADFRTIVGGYNQK